MAWTEENAQRQVVYEAAALWSSTITRIYSRSRALVADPGGAPTYALGTIVAPEKLSEMAHILIIDSQADLCERLVRLREQAGHRAPAVATVSEASTILQAEVFLLLAALVSFGLGGYVAGRLRERWTTDAHSDVVEFRDGTHGVLAWALAVLITGLVTTASVAGIASKAVQPVTSPAATTGEPVIAYELDRLFRSDRHALEGDITYSRAEAGRILLAATGRRGITSDDRDYLVRLVEIRTGLAQPDAERRVDDSIAAATTAVQRARRSAVILGFSTAVSLLAGAAGAWFASCVGGRHHVAPSLSWRWPQHA